MVQSLSDRYFALIDTIVEKTLQGKIASTERVYIMLQREIEPGTGEVWERCFAARKEEIAAQLDKKLKATRMMRALETIETQYTRLQQANQQQNEITSATQKFLDSDPEELIATLNNILDINQKQPLNRDKLQQLANSLDSIPNNSSSSEYYQQIAVGIREGLKSFTRIEDDLISWMYQSQANLGFTREKPNPWKFWQKKLNSTFPQQLFKVLAEQKSITELKTITNSIELKQWVELAILLQYIQQGLVAWYDKQPYNTQFGKQLSYSTLLTFAVIWMELSQIFSNSQFREGCFQIVLQILRRFARRDDFPLYNGIFVSFSGEYLQNTLEYFSEPIQQIPGDREKARILTLLGSSQSTLGQFQQGIRFHESALEIARKVEDKSCEIANLNHLSRTYVQQKDYDSAINYSQRALILARQIGNRLGETNALVNLGYSKVFAARQLDKMETETYNDAIRYLEQGLQLAEKAEDIPSQSLGQNSLGIAYVILEQPLSAIASLEKGAKLAQIAQNIYLQGLSYVYLGEAYYKIEEQSKTIFYSCWGMYLLNQINSVEWRKSAGLMTIIKGQIGEAAFYQSLAKFRSELISNIGVDGYDYISELLAEYQAN